MEYPIHADFYPQGVNITYKDDNGVNIYKTLKLSDFLKIAAKNTVDSTIFEVPEACRVYGEVGNKKFFVFIYEPHIDDMIMLWTPDDSIRYGNFNDLIPTVEWLEKHTDMNHMRSENPTRFRVFKIPYPRTCIIVSVTESVNKSESDYRFNSIFAYAMKRNEIGNELNKNLYRFPFTNIYPDNSCCLGGIHSGIPIRNIQAICYFPSLIFNEVGNHDLTCDDGRNFNNYTPLEAYGTIKGEYQLISKLHGKDSFPENYLLSNSQLGVVLNSLMGNK